MADVGGDFCGIFLYPLPISLVRKEEEGEEEEEEEEEEEGNLVG